jgi:hypothetical protein
MYQNKQILQDLLNKIQEIRNIGKGKISLLAGYKRENYISERLSKGEISEKVIKKITALYNKAVQNPEILSESEILLRSFEKDRDAGKILGDIMEKLIYLQASDKKQGERISILMAKVFGSDIEKESSDLEESVRGEARKLFDELNKTPR